MTLLNFFILLDGFYVVRIMNGDKFCGMKRVIDWINDTKFDLGKEINSIEFFNDLITVII